MDKYEEFQKILDQFTKDYFYRKDGSPLADLQYNLHLLANNISEMIQIFKYSHLQEHSKDFLKKMI